METARRESLLSNTHKIQIPTQAGSIELSTFQVSLAHFLLLVNRN